MERRNKGRSMRRLDELSLVKAAAWAWYQHGSLGSSDRHESREMMQKYDDVSSRVNKKPPRPSRYKLEAMKQEVQEKSEVENQGMFHLSCHVQDDPNSLLDSYEVDRISRDLECYIEASHAKYCQHSCCRFKMLSSGTRSIYHVGSKTFKNNKGKVLKQGRNSSESEMKIKQKAGKSPRGFGFMRQSTTVICGKRLDDVVDVRVKGGSSRWPEKHVAVVSLATCRPWRIN